MKIILLISLTLNFLFATINLQMQTAKIFDVTAKTAKIFDVTAKTAKINISNVTVGQSGIVLKEIDNNSIILSQAFIQQSNETGSIIEFIDNKVLFQDAIVTSLLKPSNNDKFILNHLYSTSLLIVPNEKAKDSVKELYPNQNFLNEDFFASHLKLNNTPIPTKKIITAFAQSQQIGTIFIVVQNNLYIVDSLTFKVINTQQIKNDETENKVPFFTKINDIKTTIFSFGANKIKDYNLYYLKLLGLN
ncbi:MAG: hypothetical protein ACI81I_000761 [Arcobacteraceae bacterium]|jgi:hypothetical protein